MWQVSLLEMVILSPKKKLRQVGIIAQLVTYVHKKASLRSRCADYTLTICFLGETKKLWFIAITYLWNVTTLLAKNTTMMPLSQSWDERCIIDFRGSQWELAATQHFKRGEDQPYCHTALCLQLSASELVGIACS